ncbi:MAG: DUF2155 domain-containing protein [Croceibacterium sp.]
MAVLLGGCARSAPAPEAESTEVPADIAKQALPAPPVAGAIGTPMAERVATLGLLNKRNNISRDVVLKPGESRRVGDVVVRLAACERTAPWEDPPETGAFAQVLVFERPDADTAARWHGVFSGWLFKNSPSLNVVEHPIYDVWVKDCAMNFPGEEPRPAASSSSAAKAAGTRPAIPPPSPRPTPSPAPAATASPSNPA